MINLALVKSIVEKSADLTELCDYFLTAIASISTPTSFGNRATSTQERAG